MLRLSSGLSGLSRRAANQSYKLRLTIYLSFGLIGLLSIWSGPACLVGLVFLPLMIYAQNMRQLNWRQVATDFYLAGCMLCVLSGLFLLQMSPTNWTVVLQGRFAVIARTLTWLLIAAVSSLVFVGVARVLYQMKDTTTRLMILPLVWVAAEIIRACSFGLIMYGPGGTLGPDYNFGSAAVVAAGTPLVYGSRLVGFYGLTLAVWLVNGGLYMLWRRRWLAGASLLAGVVLLTGLSWKMAEKTSDKSINVALVHLDERDSLDTWDGIDWPKSQTDLLVLPEYSEFDRNSSRHAILGRLSQDGVAVTSTKINFSPDSTNQLQYLNAGTEVVDRQDKSFLIATGEYIPYSLKALFWAMGEDKVVHDFRQSQQLRPGTSPARVYRAGDVGIGALACSGTISLGQYGQLTQQGADVLVNVASLSFLQNKSVYQVYARNMARFQAVSNQRPLIQASRSGQSYIIDAQGRTLVEQADNQTKLLEYKLKY